MRTEIQLLQSAVGTPKIDDPQRDESLDAGNFRFYSLNLPASIFRGLPPKWYFGILTEPEKRSKGANADTLLSGARKLIEEALKLNLTPLVLISDDPVVRLKDNLFYDPNPVFFIDKDKLPGLNKFPNLAHHTALIRAVREKLTTSDLSSLLFTPYKPSVPAFGWRFFGRQREIELITESTESFFVVAGRRLGKTSLLREAERRLRKSGRAVYFISVQYLSSAQQVVEEIIKTLSQREAYTAVRRSKAFDEKLLLSVIKTLSAKHGFLTLIFDELGNVIFNNSQDDWSIIGILREFAHSGRVQVIMSGFQEFFLKQLDDFNSPFVNFANTLRLKVFSDKEIEEFLLGPLGIWGHIKDKSELLKLVTLHFGRQPFILQHLGRALFERLFKSGNKDVESILKRLLDSEYFEPFVNPIDEIFFRMKSSTMRYLFLRRCREADLLEEALTSVELNDDWAKDALQVAGFQSSLNGRKLMLEGLELHGLTTSVDLNHMRQKIATPIVYRFLKYMEPDIDNLLSKLADDIKYEQSELLL